MIKALGLKDAIGLLAVIWVVSLSDLLLPLDLGFLGITPRSAAGLVGIPFSAFVHSSLFHLISNTTPLFILMILLSYSEGRSKLWTIIALGTMGAGAITWLTSTGGLVVGASGLVFAVIGYLLADCVFHPCKKSIPIGIVTFIAFGGSVFSLYHFAPHIALSAHVGGFISGIALAKFYGGKP